MGRTTLPLVTFTCSPDPWFDHPEATPQRQAVLRAMIRKAGPGQYHCSIKRDDLCRLAKVSRQDGIEAIGWLVRVGAIVIVPDFHAEGRRRFEFQWRRARGGPAPAVAGQGGGPEDPAPSSAPTVGALLPEMRADGRRALRAEGRRAMRADGRRARPIRESSSREEERSDPDLSGRRRPDPAPERVAPPTPDTPAPSVPGKSPSGPVAASAAVEGPGVGTFLAGLTEGEREAWGRLTGSKRAQLAALLETDPADRIAVGEAMKAIRGAMRAATPAPPAEASPAELVAALPSRGPELVPRCCDAVINSIRDPTSRRSWPKFEGLFHALARSELDAAPFVATLRKVQTIIAAGEAQKPAALLMTSWGELLAEMGLAWSDFGGRGERHRPPGHPAKSPRRPVPERLSAN